MLFSDQCVVVTGAGSGIGRALAQGFCRDGATVVGIGRSGSDLEETARACSPGAMHFVVGDVSRTADVDRLFAEADRRAGRIDVLVNNAASYPKVAFLDSTHEAWQLAIETNVVGLAYCCRLALQRMLPRGYGRIINLGSLAWRSPIPASSAYAVSKAAVRVLTVALAGEIDRARYPDVLVNELLPGIIKTRMSDEGADPASVYPYARNLASLPRNGPTGTTFLQGDVYIENHGLRARLGRLARRIVSR